MKQGRKRKVYPIKRRFQRTAQREKKAFFNEQCIKLEENNIRGKIIDLFRKIGDIKETFHAKMGKIKDRNHKDLTETEDIKKRWKEYIEKTIQERS